MRFKHITGALLAAALAAVALLVTPDRASAQIGINVQNGFEVCSGANCKNDLTLGASTRTNGTVLRYERVALTNAQILALLTTSVTIVAAPGSGKLVEVLGGLIVFDYTAAYTETGGNDNWRLYYGDSGKEPATNVIETTGFVDATADAIIKFGPVANDQVIQGAEMSNTAIVLSGVTGGDYTQLGGGNAANAITVFIAYRIVTTGL